MTAGARELELRRRLEWLLRWLGPGLDTTSCLVLEAAIAGEVERIPAIVAERTPLAAVLALVELARVGHLEGLDALLRSGVDPSRTTHATVTDETALSAACAAGHEEVVRRLLRAGARLEYGKGGWPALSEAAAAGHESLVDFLLEEIRRQHGREAIWAALGFAAFGGQERLFARLAARPGAEVDDRLREELAEGVRRRRRREALLRYERADELMDAVGEDDVETVRRLLAEGVHPDAAEESGELAAIHSAAMKDTADVLTLLLEAGATADLQDEDGNTALHLAAAGLHVECMHALLNAGADPSVRADDGTTAGQWVERARAALSKS